MEETLFDVLMIRKVKELDRNLNVVERVTLEGDRLYELGLGCYRIAVMKVAPEPDPEPELKPCPICGAPFEVRIRGGGYSDTPMYSAECKGCGIKTPVHMSWAQLAAAVNRRA